MRLSSPRAACSSAASDCAAAFVSREPRHAFSRAICSLSADGSTVTKVPSPAV
jgi:hypothetical protein